MSKTTVYTSESLKEYLLTPRTIYARKITAASCLKNNEGAYGKIVFIYHKGDQPGKDKPHFNVPCEVLRAAQGPYDNGPEFRISYRPHGESYTEELELRDQAFDFYEILNRNASDYISQKTAWKRADYH